MIIIPKTKNLEVDTYITFDLSFKEREDIQKEADEKEWSLGKTVHRRLFPRKNKTGDINNES